jgi:hypothetical protein
MEKAVTKSNFPIIPPSKQNNFHSSSLFLMM